jgi:hypothetical protein
MVVCPRLPRQVQTATVTPTQRIPDGGLRVAAHVTGGITVAKTSKAAKPPVKRTLDARKDTMDFRDLMFVPTLVEVPTHIPLSDFTGFKVPVLDQGSEGACTGFGLATVANYLLLRRRVEPDAVPVSPRMLYEMARRYDEWPGERYSGSSARGAMKGWHKHGVCSEPEYPYVLKRSDKRGLTQPRIADALKRPLGAYFRVNHRDLIAMHSAIAEVGVLYASATVHKGWEGLGTNGLIQQSNQLTGGHAFAIVAYDADGFWLQNSWGTDWGKKGLARVSYDDWLANGTDVWVARLGAPVRLSKVASTAIAHAETSGQSAAYAFSDLRPHVVTLGNDGELKPGGNYGTTPAELQHIFDDDIPQTIANWPVKRLLLYAHGGLVSERAAVQRLAEYRPTMLGAGVYPLAFIWNTDFWTTITNILQDAVRRRRPEGVLDSAKDFLLDRLDDALEPLARLLTGRAAWGEMKENALRASLAGHGARLVAEHVARLKQRFPDLQVHVLAHSAGSILQAPLIQLLTSTGPIRSGPMQGERGLGIEVDTCTLWAPACTVSLFKEAYLPAVVKRAIKRFALLVLSDKVEQDDNCAGIYHKSLLYLVSNALDERLRNPFERDGVPILGLAKFVKADADLAKLFTDGAADLVMAPNDEPMGTPGASLARHHGDFDDEARTVAAALARIVAAQPAKRAGAATAAAPVKVTPPTFLSSASSLRRRRLEVDVQTRVLR